MRKIKVGRCDLLFLVGVVIVSTVILISKMVETSNLEESFLDNPDMLLRELRGILTFEQTGGMPATPLTE